jgi:hypothetical protein
MDEVRKPSNSEPTEVCRLMFVPTERLAYTKFVGKEDILLTFGRRFGHVSKLCEARNWERCIIAN